MAGFVDDAKRAFKSFISHTRACQSHRPELFYFQPRGVTVRWLHFLCCVALMAGSQSGRLCLCVRDSESSDVFGLSLFLRDNSSCPTVRKHNTQISPLPCRIQSRANCLNVWDLCGVKLLAGCKTSRFLQRSGVFDMFLWSWENLNLIIHKLWRHEVAS